MRKFTLNDLPERYANTLFPTSLGLLNISREIGVAWESLSLFTLQTQHACSRAVGTDMKGSDLVIELFKYLTEGIELFAITASAYLMIFHLTSLNYGIGILIDADKRENSVCDVQPFQCRNKISFASTTTRASSDSQGSTKTYVYNKHGNFFEYQIAWVDKNV